MKSRDIFREKTSVRKNRTGGKRPGRWRRRWDEEGGYETETETDRQTGRQTNRDGKKGRGHKKSVRSFVVNFFFNLRHVR